eukprot:312662-Amorphochlora_amoeboformis.AAC.1
MQGLNLVRSMQGLNLVCSMQGSRVELVRSMQGLNLQGLVLICSMQGLVLVCSMQGLNKGLQYWMGFYLYDPETVSYSDVKRPALPPVFVKIAPDVDKQGLEAIAK